MVSRRNLVKTIAVGGLSMGSGIASSFTAGDASMRDVRSLMPALSCDCHSHIIGPYDRFPMLESRRYTPPPASVEDLETLHRKLGIERSVLVQPSFYGFDNACLLAALQVLGPTARGVAAIPDDLAANELDRWRIAGITGIRINQAGGCKDPRILTGMIERAGKQAAELGWHVQLFLPLTVIASLARTIEASPAVFVLDHFAGAKATGVRQEGFDAVLGLMKAGRAYSKLSAPYHEAQAPGYAGMGELAAAFINANPGQVLWGTDWPHTPWLRDTKETRESISPFYPVDNMNLIEKFFEWVPDKTTQERILVKNPAKLFGFS
ncbi:putative TIM-barrel fold metal-dependent hydrolase [Caballeronia udeis]|uniref:TIM-barrel fold metal-dependent hydrolase n=1 Tax=Caballeronia udeis TaxID=1232866 RepID=A0ABW8MJ11_9BURK